MPHPPPVDLSDAIIAPTHRNPQLLDCAFNAISDSLKCDVLTYTRVRARSCFLAAIQGASFHHYLADAGSSAYCDVRDHSGIDALSKSQLRNIERLRRKAEKDLGDVAAESATGSAIGVAFEQFLILEATGWKGEDGTGTALALDERKRKFYRKLLTRLADAGRARIDLLHIGGRLAAGHLAIRAGRTWFLLKIGYDPAFRDYGPGTILLRMFLEEMSSTAGVDEVNLTTNPTWADRWHFQVEPVHNVVVYGRTLRGRTLSAERAAKEMIKAVRDRIPTRDTTPDP
jgi:CelD/BcsL family acetyltransferase involved in cellulose biosynthesis